ncbi:hypothetical protein [Syntrophomonas palmitatica]|uniref:hypothetical protein n=1 Tax=Syntrophomonas palmitatica TaxID=402877 RepID=UPI000AB1BB7A
MINQIKTRLGYYLYPNSLRMQLLSRLLIILALLLVLIGLFQYIFMRDVVYRNKAASLQSQVMSIPPPAWEFFNNDQEMVSPDRPLVFVHEAALAFIDANGQYSLLLRGRDGVKPPQLQPYEYKAALNEQPAPHYHVTSTGGVEQLVVLRPVRSFTGEAAGVIEISTPTGPLKELLIHQLLTFLFLALSA